MVNPISVRFIESTAERLIAPEKSLGRKTSRIQVVGLDGLDSLKKHFAIALSSGKTMQRSSTLTWTDKLLGVVLLKVKDGDEHEGYVKVNANSLRKRFNIEKEEFNTVSKENGGDLTSLISQKLLNILLSQALDCSDQKRFEKAMKYFENAQSIDQSGVFNFLQQPDLQDNVAAQNFLAYCYEKGIGVEPDLKKALELYQEAAGKNHAMAMNYLGNYYSLGRASERDPTKAFEWYQKAADNGSFEAMYHLGESYEQGLGTEIDQQKAFEWYQKAANEAFAKAMCKVGYCYEKGVGTEMDPEQAFVWYQTTAGAGLPDAMYHLGRCYHNGIGVMQNTAKALEWYGKASLKDYTEAMYAIGNFYLENGQFDKTVEWYQKAANKGHAEAMYSLGKLYQERGYVREAVEWYQRAAKEGHSEAMYALGNLHIENGYTQQGIEWYQKAASKGHATAMFNLGYCYEKGIGVPINLIKALEWYQKAATKGLTPAVDRLKEFSEAGLFREPLLLAHKESFIETLLEAKIITESRLYTFAECYSLYKKLALKLHPDKNPSPESREKFKLLAIAWKNFTENILQTTKKDETVNTAFLEKIDEELK